MNLVGLGDPLGSERVEKCGFMRLLTRIRFVFIEYICEMSCSKVQNMVRLEEMGITMLVSGSHDYNLICEY